MALRDSIQAIVAATPADGSVTLPVRWLADLLASDGAPAAMADVSDASIDLTVAQLAAKLDKGESTIRTWLARGELPGAYRSHGREWRIPLAAVEAMQQAQANSHRAARAAAAARSNAPVDIGAWRRHMPASAAGVP